ncbi:EpsG family protein [Vibrio splendidus]
MQESVIYGVIAIICSSFSMVSNKFIDRCFLILFGLFVFLVSYYSQYIFVANDLVAYEAIFNQMPYDYLDVDLARLEPFLSFLMITSKKFELDFSGFWFIHVLLYLCIVIFAIHKNFKYTVVVLILLSSSSIFTNFSVNVIRQGMAFAILLCMIPVNKMVTNILLFILGVMIHVSFIFPALVILFIRKRNVTEKHLMILLLSSLLFHFVDIGFLISNFFNYIPEFGPLIRLKQNLLNQETVEVRGRIYYAITFIVAFFTLIYYRKAQEAISRTGDNKVFFDVSFKFIVICLVLYPIFNQVGYLVRLVNYGLVLSPILLYYALSTFFCLFSVNVNQSKVMINILSILYSIFFITVYLTGSKVLLD